MPDDEVLAVARSRLGRVLRGKYRLDRILGVGGMAVVYAATHRNKKRFAIKMLHPELSMREGIRTRFLREGYVANSVEHPGAVAVLDDDVAEDGSAFIVMELLEGAPVDEVWGRHEKRMPLSMVLSIGDALLDVLVAAHARKIVHRDIKPANLFLTSDGRLEVLDFGIARLQDSTAGEATATGAMLGTPAFMAPEQAQGESSKVDAQTDLWAVGATMFSLLTGEFVHAGNNAQQLLISAGTKPARPIGGVAADVPGPVAAVIDKALAFDKGGRWASAKAMREALAAACQQSTGAPIAPLPRISREEKVTGLEDTVSSSEELPRASSGMEHAATEAAPSDGRPPSGLTPTTGAPVAGTKATLPPGPARGRWRVRIGLGAAACALLGGGVILATRSRAPRISLCAEMTLALDGPRCITPLPLEAMKAREHSMRFTWVGGKVAMVERVNMAGRRVGPCELRWEVSRNGDGSVREIALFDHHDHLVEKDAWSDGGRRVDFTTGEVAPPEQCYGDGWHAWNLRSWPKANISAEQLQFDDRGFVTRETFLGPTGRPRAERRDFYGFDHVVGRNGRDIRWHLLAADGRPGVSWGGLSAVDYSDDDTPAGSELSFTDIEGRPTCNGEGFQNFRRTYDALYRETSFMDFGIHGEPAVNIYLGTRGVQETMDPARRTYEEVLVDETGHPRPFKGDAAAMFRNTLDERGREVLNETLDPNGNLVSSRDNDGVATTRTHYDDRDDVIEMEELDPAGALVLNGEHFARWTATHDDHGREVEVRYFDASGRPTARQDMAPVLQVTWDERGNQAGTAFFDGDGHPFTNSHGYASIRWKYDRFRNEVERAVFGPDGRPCTDDEGVSVLRRNYDEHGDLVGISYYDENGVPALHDGQWASKRVKNDERGLVIEESYFDAHGEPTTIKEGYSRVSRQRDRLGDVIQEAYFGKEGQPTVREGGYATRRTTYDIHRRAIEAKLFDAQGVLAPGADRWAIERTSYDERTLPVRHDRFDAAGQPVLASRGASDTLTYDARGNVVQEATLGVDGKPVAPSSAGYATKKSEYDDHDQLVAESLFDADGKLAAGKDGWSIRKLRYDEAGNVIEEAFFDADHKPVAPKSGEYASVRSRFDPRLHLIESSWLDVTGAPAKGPDGAAIVRYERDTYGRATRTSYFDGAGVLTVSKEGKIVVSSRYDSAGRLMEERFLDASGAPRPALDGCAGHSSKYDPQGHKVEESCLDTKDALTLSVDGWALRRIIHDARGNDVEVSTYGPDGKLRADNSGIARRRNRYDERNRIIDRTFFDASDRPAHDKRGVHETRFTYSEVGQPLPERYFDEKGRVVQPR